MSARREKRLRKLERTLDDLMQNIELTKTLDLTVNRLLAKLSGTIKIADTSNQGETESKAFSAIAVPLREDTKPFHKTNSVFNKDTFA